MQKIKVLCVFGTRPEATKMVPLILTLSKSTHIETVVCVTAQHRELLDDVLEPFHIKPHYDLNLMLAGQSLSDIMCRALKGLETVIADVQPDLLLVHGDTSTTVAASMAAFYAHVKIGHVEAGLRTYDKYRPFPEEINRKLTTVMADLHFAPTLSARDHLLAENIPASSIYVTGNTAIDLVGYTGEPRAFDRDVLNQVDFGQRMIVLTAHRRENWGTPMEQICRAAKRIVDDFPDVTLVWPMHPNPAVTEPAKTCLGGHERILLTDAVGVMDLHQLMRRAYLVMTDSGGIQEEATALHKPTVVMREVTERPEGVDAGVLTLAGVQEDGIYNETVRLLTDKACYDRMRNAVNPFGDGHASERVLQAILHAFGIDPKQPDDFK